MSDITRLERWLDRRPGEPVIEGTEPDGWLTKPPTDAEIRGLPDPETGDDGDIVGFGDL